MVQTRKRAAMKQRQESQENSAQKQTTKNRITCHGSYFKSYIMAVASHQKKRNNWRQKQKRKFSRKTKGYRKMKLTEVFSTLLTTIVAGLPMESYKLGTHARFFWRRYVWGFLQTETKMLQLFQIFDDKNFFKVFGKKEEQWQRLLNNRSQLRNIWEKDIQWLLIMQKAEK